MTDAVQADLPHAGGLLAETRCADERVAAVFVQATVGNRTAQARSVPVALMLLDEKGATVGMERGEARVPAGGSASFSSVFHIENPRLWSPDHPALYTLACRITNENGEEDTYEETTGIRFAQITEQGFSLNGKPLKLWGVNRHQQYPYIGLAAPMRRSAGRHACSKAWGSMRCGSRTTRNPPRSSTSATGRADPD